MEQEQSCIQVDLKAETEKPDEVFIEIELPYNLYQYLSSENCDVQKICRICLAVDSKEMFPLGTEKENNVLAQMLTAVCCIQIDETDGLPSQICANCQTLTVQSYEFKAQSERADHTLRSILKGEFLIKQETVLQDSRSFVKDDKPDDVDVKLESEITDELPTHLISEKYTENEKSTNKEEILHIINNNNKENNNIDVSVTDSNTLLKEIITKKGINRKKRRKVYKCSSCPKNFVKLGLLKEHRKLEHNTETQLLSCDYCKDSFNSEHDLNLHLSLHKVGPAWKCIQCHKEFNGKNELSRHIKRHMETKKYSCGNCEKSFAELYALRRHARVHTGESLEKKHACHLCDKRYSESNALANHLKRHSGLRPCVCATCGKSFPSQRLLHSHALVHSDNKPYGCNYCDKRFRHESTRNTHQRLHTGEKPYVCSACGKTFVQASNLTLHMRTHTGERPYSCTVCSRKFTSGSSLKTHLRIHTGERPFTCNVCGKSFARQNLRAHMRHHSGERPFECNVCAKKFINAARLREHVRTHTGEKPFECASCPRKFPTKTHLTTHMKAHEKKKKAERRILIHPKSQTTENDLKPLDEVSEEINKEIFIDDQNIETNVVLVSSDNTLTNAEIPIIDKELVIDDNDSIETNILVVDHNDKNTVHILENDINYTVNEGVVSIASGVLEGTTVKLHQLDQSLVQIHSSGGQVTISKITSKMTANF